MSPSLPTPAFLYILDILCHPPCQNFPFFHNCHATPGDTACHAPQKNSERALVSFVQFTDMEVENTPPYHHYK